MRETAGVNSWLFIVGKIEVPHARQLGNVRVAVGQLGAKLEQQFHQFERGTFTRIVDIFFVGDSRQYRFCFREPACAAR